MVAGGCGFVGSNLALSINRQFNGVRVTAFDSLSRRGSEKNIPRLMKAGIRFIHGDIRSIHDLRLLDPFDLLLDCAADPSAVSGSDGVFLPLYESNVTGTMNLAERCSHFGAGMIFLSTNRVYPYDALNALEIFETETRWEHSGGISGVEGVTNRGITEEFTVDGPKTFYGASKLCCEILLRELCETAGLRVIADRCAVICGPWQMGKVDQGILALWVAKHLRQEPLSYFGYDGSGRQSRDFLHIDDLCDLIMRQIRESYIKSSIPQKFELFNVGGGRANLASLCELTNITREETGIKIEVQEASRNVRRGDLISYATDNTRVTTRYDWSPVMSVRDSIRDTAEWLRRNPDILEEVF